MLGYRSTRDVTFYYIMARVEQRATECSYLPFKPIHELQGYFSSPSCLSSWAVLLVLMAHWMWGGEGTWAMSSERVPGMAKGPVSDVSICSGGLCHMPTFAKPLKDLEFMLELQEPSERFLRNMLFGFFITKVTKSLFVCVSVLNGLQDLSSWLVRSNFLTRDWTHTPCSGYMAS